MNVLLLGSGGREHALAWKLAQSPRLDSLHAIPGNPGIAAYATCHAVTLTDHAAVIQFCRAHAIGFVVVGPEAPLVDGLSDSLRAAGLPVFGPSQAAAQLEGSKGFTKDLCARENIPTAGYVRVSDLATARAALARDFPRPVVIKADGLAAGKGVTVAFSDAEADAAVAAIFEKPGGEAVKRQASSSSPTAPASCRWARRRTTSASGTAMSVLTPVAWAPIARRAC